MVKQDPKTLGGNWFYSFFFVLLLLTVSSHMAAGRVERGESEESDFSEWLMFSSAVVLNVMLIVPYTLALTHRYDDTGLGGGARRHGIVSTGLKRYVGTARLGSTVSPSTASEIVTTTHAKRPARKRPKR